MVAIHVTESFPADVDRDAFGHWLSGFTDGEGHFGLSIHHVPRPNGKIYACPGGRFEIILRDDDSAILQLIRSFLGVGWSSLRKGYGTGRPVARYCVTAAAALGSVVIPHFIRYPLRAKKAGDFAIWKRGVELLHLVSLRPKTGKAGGNGTIPRWSEEERTEFVALVAAIKQQRCYSST